MTNSGPHSSTVGGGNRSQHWLSHVTKWKKVEEKPCRYQNKVDQCPVLICALCVVIKSRRDRSSTKISTMCLCCICPLLYLCSCVSWACVLDRSNSSWQPWAPRGDASHAYATVYNMNSTDTTLLQHVRHITQVYPVETHQTCFGFLSKVNYVNIQSFMIRGCSDFAWAVLIWRVILDLLHSFTCILLHYLISLLLVSFICYIKAKYAQCFH